jgi:hypothetical protein
MAYYLHQLLGNHLRIDIRRGHQSRRPVASGGGDTMERQTEIPISATSSGMDRLVEKYRRQFRIPENLNHYSEADYQQAEREYLRYCLGRSSG